MIFFSFFFSSPSDHNLDGLNKFECLQHRTSLSTQRNTQESLSSPKTSLRLPQENANPGTTKAPEKTSSNFHLLRGNGELTTKDYPATTGCSFHQSALDMSGLKRHHDGKIAGLYDLDKTLGRGHFAVVKLARHVFTGEKVGLSAHEGVLLYFREHQLRRIKADMPKTNEKQIQTGLSGLISH